MSSAIVRTLAAVVCGCLGAAPVLAGPILEARAERVLLGLRGRLCAAAARLAGPPRQALAAACAVAPQAPVAARRARLGPLPPDGTIVNVQRLGAHNGTALDLVAYVSSGLVVAGVVCLPLDGQRHAGILHVHGGFGGLFDDPNNPLQACIDWAALHGRVAFMPSLRGQDGGEGQPELCLGEADDVAAAAKALRSYKLVDARRVALIGGSTGACVALRAAASIPDLRAVVAFVPPADWQALVQFHRTAFEPATEVLCDGTQREWNVGGPALADVIDGLICGHPDCSPDDYAARSPLAGVRTQAAPTLIVAAGDDNIVPVEQQHLWSVLRAQLGHPVNAATFDRCAAPSTPALDFDVLLHVPGAFHLLSPGAISSGLLFAMAQLDQPLRDGGD